MSDQQKVMEARKKLAEKYEGNAVRLGGKGTMKRKIKVTSKGNNIDNKQTKELVKKLGCQPLPELTEINFFTKDNKVISFKNAEVYGNIQSHVFIVSGANETKDLKSCFAEVINQLSAAQLENIKGTNLSTKKEEAPELVNFEEAAKL